MDDLTTEAETIWSVERSEALVTAHMSYDRYDMTAYVRFDMPGDLHVSAGFEGSPWSKMAVDERRAAMLAAVTGKDNEIWRAVGTQGFAKIYARVNGAGSK